MPYCSLNLISRRPISLVPFTRRSGGVALPPAHEIATSSECLAGWDKDRWAAQGKAEQEARAPTARHGGTLSPSTQRQHIHSLLSVLRMAPCPAGICAA